MWRAYGWTLTTCLARRALQTGLEVLKNQRNRHGSIHVDPVSTCDSLFKL